MGISSIEEPDSSGFCGYCNVCTNFHKINRSLRTSFHCIRQKNCLLLTEDFIKKTSHIPNYFIRCNNTVLNNFKSKNGCQFLYFSSVFFNSQTLLKIQYSVLLNKKTLEKEKIAWNITEGWNTKLKNMQNILTDCTISKMQMKLKTNRASSIYHEKLKN